VPSAIQRIDVSGNLSVFGRKQQPNHTYARDLTNLDPRGIGIDRAMLDLAGHTGYLDKTSAP